ncbi:hypothetical protein RE432_18370 [Pusillimonas sp. SM2304]|uniref:hypothetical protein n=1 Tax=Pusillimonas sp. SM2304 TaxID=3073241 RepID=UPI002875B49A|nr:hypothetical protein [Pusillimonas sp. SM2304]MDS1142403.1 hypothetical protein [Pusillimonas sp. SM2304]
MIDQAFEQRLENWGRYYSSGRGGSNSSPTAVVCEQMAIAAGKTITDGYRELHPAPEIDEADAQTIEYCWARSDYRIDARLRGLLKAHYIHRNDKRGTCRVLQIRLRSYDAFLEDAVRQFQQSVALYESAVHNYAKTNGQPAKAV